ncbi:MAG: VWA domain-containing protein [Deltaproteobacteria bacterium]|nr:VWA domain-containing protein [Deltaproteobacteria bacterium]
MMRDQELAGLAMTLGRDANIKITVGGNTSYCTTDGTHINIARMPATPLGRMLMTGLVFHEVGHKNYTRGDRPDGLLGDMMNVIEDIRVDRETIKDRPGTCFNLEAVTTHYVNKGSLEPKDLPQALLGKVMVHGFGRVLRQQSILTLEPLCDEIMDDAFGPDFIDEVAAIIKDIPKLRNTAEATAMAQQLIDLLIQQQAPPLPQQSKQQQGQQEEQEEPDNSHEATGSQQQPGDDGGTVEPDVQDTQQPDKRGQEDDGGVQADGAGGNGGGCRPTPEQIVQIVKIKTGYGDLSRLIQAELNEMADSVPYDKRATIPTLPFIGRLQPAYGRLDEVEALSASSRMRAKLMGMLQAVKRRPKSYGLSGRKLVSRRLPWLETGDPRIFSRKVETAEINTAVMVLLDLSGSMCDSYEVANAAAFALHTTLFGLKGVAVCTLEFSGKDQQPDVNLLVEFGRKPLSENFNHRPVNGTPTHNAIWAARALLLARPEPRKIMLILTDGSPDSEVDTTAATRKAMRDGIEIAAIGIIDENVRHFWDNHRIIESIRELPAAMFGIMEGLLTRGNESTGRRCAS